MAGLFDSTAFSIMMVRFWRVPWHREALQVLAEAVTQSDEADRLSYEWDLISAGIRAEIRLRQGWSVSLLHSDDPYGWQYSDKWRSINSAYGPPRARHRACLCKWLYSKGYPQTIRAHGGIGDAGGRARRIIADLDSAVANLPRGLTEPQIERAIAEYLGWQPRDLKESA